MPLTGIWLGGLVARMVTCGVWETADVPFRACKAAAAQQAELLQHTQPYVQAAAALTSATTPFSSTPVSGDGLALVRPWESVNVASCGHCDRQTAEQ